MSKAVMLSIRPKWVEKISNGEKTIEVRKTRPKLDTPFKCYIYCTQSGVALGAWGKHGKVIGEFTCDRIFPINVFDNGGIQNWFFGHMERSCLTYEELTDYIGNGRTGHGWHISDLAIYDEPIELARFHECSRCDYPFCGEQCHSPLTRPPQSWCYVEAM